jgi:hypothetical protein
LGHRPKQAVSIPGHALASTPQVEDGGGSSHIQSTCGRYASFLPVDVLAQFFEVEGPLPNMAPTKLAPIVRLDPETGARRIDAFQ